MDLGPHQRLAPGSFASSNILCSFERMSSCVSRRELVALGREQLVDALGGDGRERERPERREVLLEREAKRRAAAFMAGGNRRDGRAERMELYRRARSACAVDFPRGAHDRQSADGFEVCRGCGWGSAPSPNPSPFPTTAAAPIINMSIPAAR